MRVYLFIFLLLILQIYVAKFFSLWGIIPDIVTVFIVIFALKNGLSDSLKIAVFTGVLQDLMYPPGIPVNTISKSFIVLLVSNIKQKFYYSSISVKFFLIFVVTAVDTGLKGFITYLSTGILDFSPVYLAYILVNFLTFYVVSVFDEIR
ncbi:rod shape-determining protein MreD [Persephonella atlantica]|uniref:Rod shape-determining protein MreD n=1 Tax=Persephonella atlantica TaxID=2699429 RepID=A0ABS1GK06_9AQUI|nr:rod shape-determining protein MreD [Persephonella atlantica]MBK3333165.1 rod shape-determining protein MreD [Persephonella atlantica]